MKKFLKVISSLCLVLVVGTAVLLSGCAKKFNVNISCTGGGEVLARGENGISIAGDNEVEKGANFDIVISANEGYYISKVTVDGKEKNIAEWTKDKFGWLTYHILTLTNVEADRDVVIVFAPQQSATVSFMYSDGTKTTFLIPQETTFKFNEEGKTISAKLYEDNAKTVKYSYNGINLKTTTEKILYVEAGVDKVTLDRTLQLIFSAEKGCSIINLASEA